MEGQNSFVLLFIDGLEIKPPFLDSLVQQYPCGLLSASSDIIGLAPGTNGNGAANYLTIGAGRILPWGEARISHAIKARSFKKQFEALKQIQQLKQSGGTLHLIGCTNTSEEHAKKQHLDAIVSEANALGIKNVVHPIVHELKGSIPTHLAEDKTLHADRSDTARDALLNEMMLSQNDAILFFNFEYTTLRQLVESFKNRVLASKLITLTDYGVEGIEAMFPLENVTMPLSEVLATQGVSHLKIFDPIKFPLLTHYLNGKHDGPFVDETWERVDDGAAVFKKIITEVAAGPKVIFASSSILSETTSNPRSIEGSILEIKDILLRFQGTLVILSAYGKEDQVPFIAISKDLEGKGKGQPLQVLGDLSDVAPTVLKLLHIPQPHEMTGKPLL